jgi:hypothetical protein
MCVTCTERSDSYREPRVLQYHQHHPSVDTQLTYPREDLRMVADLNTGSEQLGEYSQDQGHKAERAPELQPQTLCLGLFYDRLYF